MPREPNRFEPRDRPIGGLIPGNWRDNVGTGTSTGSTDNGGFPADGSPVEQYPGLIWKNGMWFDPGKDQYYDPYSGNKVSPHDSPAPVVTTPEGGERQGGVYRPPPDPGDGPVGDFNAWLNGYDPLWYQNFPGAQNYNQTPRGEPNIYIQSPGMPGGGDGGGPANPMPEMPTIGTQGMSPHERWSSQARSAGQDTFRPWGQPISYMSEALRYGGVPDVAQAGGLDPAMIMAMQSAALRS